MNNKRLELNIWNKIWHHWLTILLLTIGLLMFYISTIHSPNPIPATMSPKSIFVFGLILLGLSIMCFFWLESKLTFEKIEIGFEKTKVVEIIVETAKKNNWFADNEIPLTAERIELTKLNTPGTPNEIVIELTDKFVFVNARGNYPTDKKIIKKLRMALQGSE